jgi:hypothetical protein
VHINIGDVVSFGSEFDGHPAGTMFTAVPAAGSHDCTIEGVPAVLVWKFRLSTEEEIAKLRRIEAARKAG